MASERFNGKSPFCVSGTQANQIALMSHFALATKSFATPMPTSITTRAVVLPLTLTLQSLLQVMRAVSCIRKVCSVAKVDDVITEIARTCTRNTSNKGGGTSTNGKKLRRLEQ